MNPMDEARPQTTFVRGNAHLDRLLAHPDVSSAVVEANVEAEETDRVLTRDDPTNSHLM